MTELMHLLSGLDWKPITTTSLVAGLAWSLYKGWLLPVGVVRLLLKHYRDENDKLSKRNDQLVLLLEQAIGALERR